MRTTFGDRWVLRAPGARVQLRDAEGDRVWMSVQTAHRADSHGTGAHLAREAVRTASVRGVRVVETVLDAMTPQCGIVLESLRDLIGSEVDFMTMRRAGTSVFVTLRLAARPVLPVASLVPEPHPSARPGPGQGARPGPTAAPGAGRQWPSADPSSPGPSALTGAPGAALA